MWLRRSPLERLRSPEETRRVVRPPWLRLAALIGRRFPKGYLNRYRLLVHKAGLVGRLLPEEIIGFKVLAGFGGVVIGIALRAFTAQAVGQVAAVTLPILTAFAGFLLPDFWLRRQIARRRYQIIRTLPDFVDLLAATVSAGLSLDAAIDRIVRRFPGPLGEEFQRYLWEVQLGRRRGEALSAMAERIDSDDLRLLASALTQADLFGIPVANVLRAQADDLRDRRFQQARERARKAPIWMIPAIALFFCPILFLLIFAPLILRLRASGALKPFGF
ncbi:MAG: type II secretion system F family protein [Armatimonadota bacterium]|jgi:tight adherence protein C|nr:type II secretion system F family protein [Armatimonadota bacterium]MDT7972629.1 type II secretion system F family protein [Armatimonadota bacterium]